MDQAQNLRNIVKKHIESDDSQRNARVITVTSGKGGVGKTSVSLNLAIQFSKMGKKVIILDADFGLANIEVMIGAIPKYNLSDMIYRGKNLQDILMAGPSGIQYISGGSGISRFKEMSKDQIIYLLHEFRKLESMADIIIIDTGAGISHAVMEFVASGREILLVTTPEPTSITDAYSLLKALNRHEAFDREHTVIRLVANKVNDYKSGESLYNKLDMVVSRFLQMKLEFLGMIPDDERMSKSIIMQNPVSVSFPESRASRSFLQIAEILTDKREEYEYDKRGLSYIFAKYFGIRRGNRKCYPE